MKNKAIVGKLPVVSDSRPIRSKLDSQRRNPKATHSDATQPMNKDFAFGATAGNRSAKMPYAKKSPIGEVRHRRHSAE